MRCVAYCFLLAGTRLIAHFFRLHIHNDLRLLALNESCCLLGGEDLRPDCFSRVHDFAALAAGANPRSWRSQKKPLAKTATSPVALTKLLIAVSMPPLPVAEITNVTSLLVPKTVRRSRQIWADTSKEISDPGGRQSGCAIAWYTLGMHLTVQPGEQALGRTN